jgi:hypothetical protein
MRLGCRRKLSRRTRARRPHSDRTHSRSRAQARDKYSRALAETYFAFMPIHEKLRGRDFATTHNYLRVWLCSIHDELIMRMDRAALERALIAGAAA